MTSTVPASLAEFFHNNPRLALAFSGGVDSAYLLHAATFCGADVTAYYVKSAFQPDFELEDAKKLAAELGATMKILPVDVLADPTVAANPVNRCYYCKKQIFSRILQATAEDGYPLIIDGTNASDDAGDRPGMVALREMSVRSPLRECGLTKPEIRELSREAGLFTWNKPAYACLATRIPTGVAITPEMLRRTELAEDFLFRLGFTNFRVRLLGNAARLQMEDEQIPRLLEYRDQIVGELKQYYSEVLLDLDIHR